MTEHIEQRVTCILYFLLPLSSSQLRQVAELAKHVLLVLRLFFVIVHFVLVGGFPAENVLRQGDVVEPGGVLDDAFGLMNAVIGTQPDH